MIVISDETIALLAAQQAAAADLLLRRSQASAAMPQRAGQTSLIAPVPSSVKPSLPSLRYVDGSITSIIPTTIHSSIYTWQSEQH
jgi:hypothetical protein